tara:strand:+ start:743 stop:970 length:228 start_codon:yes stop_codon:yes gene_type:complete
MRETNIELITRVCEFAKTGPMAQLFLLDAIMRHSDLVSGLTVEDVAISFGNNPMLSPEGWHAAACEWKEELDNRK